MRTAKKIIKQAMINGVEDSAPLSEAEEFKLIQYLQEIENKLQYLLSAKIFINKLLKKTYEK